MRLFNIYAKPGDFLAVTTCQTGTWYGDYIAADEDTIVLGDPDHEGGFLFCRTEHVVGVVLGASAKEMHLRAEEIHRRRQQGIGNALEEILNQVARQSEEPMQ